MLLNSKSSSKWSNPESIYRRWWVDSVELIGRQGATGSGSSNLWQGALFSGIGEAFSYRRDKRVNSWWALATIWSFWRMSHSGMSRTCRSRAAELLNVCSCDKRWLVSDKPFFTRAISSRRLWKKEILLVIEFDGGNFS